MRSLVLFLLAASGPAAAMEGHWRPDQVPALAPELEELGFAQSADLADLSSKPLSAVLDLDYCSGAFVSPEGLVATAYHCVTDGLQFASGPGENLFEEGFHARSRDEERWAGPGQPVRLTLATEDVTEQVLAGTQRFSGPDRLDRIDRNIRGLVRRCESGPDLHCEVAMFGDGASYELITQQDFRDVRLVYAPPRSVGYFGGDADNWRWPRHSGDFAFLRVYASADGGTGDHHFAHVPYRPEHWIPVAPRGPEPGTSVLVAGYPNLSFRWRSAAELDFAQEDAYPLRIEVRKQLLDILETHLSRIPDLAPKIAPRRLEISNDLVYLEGTQAQLQRVQLAQARWDMEEHLVRWIAADDDRFEQFGHIFPRIHRLQADEAATWPRDHLVSEMTRQVDLLHAAVRLHRLAVEAERPARDRAAGYQNRDRPALAEALDQRDPRWDWRIDRAILRYFLLEHARLPAGLHVPGLDRWLAGEGTVEQRVDARLDHLFRNTDLSDPDRRRALMEGSRRYLETSGDPWLELAAALHPHLDKVRRDRREREAEWREVAPLYTEALQAFIPDAQPRYLSGSSQLLPGQFYPDANGTLRMTFGKVDGYIPRDGLIAAPHTTLDGLRRKAGSHPYDAPDFLLEAIAAGGFDTYEDPRWQSVPVNFLSTLDTARGSSGSPTLNAEGELVGIIFDGNYEAIASDWVFDPAMTRSIHTDMSYVLWYLDRIANAPALLEEIGVQPRFAGVEVGAAEEE